MLSAPCFLSGIKLNRGDHGFLDDSAFSILCFIQFKMRSYVSGLIALIFIQVSQHHLAALTASGQVLVWRNQHGNIRSRCDGWEYISDLESKGVVLIDISGPDVDRRVAGYAPEQEDQVGLSNFENCLAFSVKK